MSFRSLVINNRCKLEYSLNYLVVNKGDETKRVLLDEVKMIIINSTQVSITSALISECINKKIKILFGDVKHNLVGEITPYKNNYYANKKIKEQISFKEERKNLLWQQIVKMKIKGQADNLKIIGKSDVADLLYSYSNEVELGDVTNREGLAAKLYFRAAFGKDFYRDDDSIEANTYLNYGYTIILSSFNRSIKALGYYTESRFHHIGETNSFNFSCDLMEPLRPLVDLYYHDRYGLEADGVLHLKDGRYALLEFKLGSSEIDEGAKHLCEIEHLIKEYNEKEKQVSLRLPDLKIVITGTQYGYRREDGVFVIPIGCLKD